MANVNTRIVLRNDTAANWETYKNTAKLLPGEVGIENDTGRYKIGKTKPGGGYYTWAELDYATADNSIVVENEAALPKPGVAGITYYVKEDGSIRRWNATESSYDSYGGSGADLSEITQINGGNANVTD